MDAGRALRVHLIGRDNGAGLSRDLMLVRDILAGTPGFEVSMTAIGRRSGLRKRVAPLARRLLGLSLRSPRYDVNVMFEHVRTEYLAYASRNVLIPNPEWFDAAWLPQLARFDAILAKTRHAEHLFRERGARALYAGFTSDDRFQPEVPRQRAFVHISGRSGNKGTLALIELWRSHPQWPTLIVVWRRKRVDFERLPANVDMHREYISPQAVAELQNRCLFHLCPSRTEGFGHSLVEALGVGAVTVTVDAEPMNEIVAPGRGLRVRARAGGRQALATLHDFEPASMADAVETCLAMDDATIASIGRQARAWFLANDRQFRERLPRLLRDIAWHDRITPSPALPGTCTEPARGVRRAVRNRRDG